MKKTALLIIAAFLSAYAPPFLTADPDLTGLEEKPLEIADLAIPETLGKIDGRFAGTSDRWVILIQDIHAHLPAQENISAIVDHLNQLYGFETFALEGGWSKTKLFKSNHAANSRAKQQLARALLEEEYITGPAYSALFSAKPLKLIGIENKTLYEENRAAFLRLLEGKKEAEEKITAEETLIAELKKELYNPALLEFDAGLSQFREGEKADVFLPSLLTLSGSVQADLSDLDQIKLFGSIVAAEAGIDSEKLKSEAKRLMEISGDPRLSFEEMLRSGQITEAQIQRYPQTLKFKEVLKLQDALSHHAFFSQVETAISRIKEKLFQNEEEKKLDARFERFVRAKKIILLEAVPEDVKRAAAERKILKEEISQAGLLEPFLKGARFYTLAKKRDSSFFKNIVSQPLLAGNIAVVAGGFHTEGLTARFEKMGVSYMIITPGLGEDNAPPDQELYYKRMAEEQTLAHLQNRFFTGNFDEGFVEGIKELASTNNIPQAVETVMNFTRRAVKRDTKAAGGPLSVESFLAMDAAAQKSTVENWLENAKQASLPIVLAAKTSVLQELLKDPAALAYWKNYVAPDRNTTVAELRDNEEYLTELLGMKAGVVRMNTAAGEDVGPLIAKKFLAGDSKRPVALIDPSYESGEFLVLPASPASLLAARLLLENKLSGNRTAEFLKQIQTLLNEIFAAQSLLEQAA